MKVFLCLLITFTAYQISNAQRKINLTSPDGKIEFRFSLLDNASTYSVFYKKKEIIGNSVLSLSFNEKKFGNNVQLNSPRFRQGIEEYELLVGKASKVKESFKEVTLPLEDRLTHAKVNVIVRAFNDAVAFRYEFVSIPGKDSLVLTEEETSFAFPSNTIVKTLELPNYRSSHEGIYTTSTISDLKENSLMDMPSLFQTQGVYVGITEAALIDYAGMYLTKKDGKIRSDLSPWPGQTVIKVKAKLPHKSPWRVILISDRIGELIESNVLTNLNAPSTFNDVSWIKPGKTTFPWWNGNVLPDTLNAPGNNFITQKYYIDFCARNKIEYHSVVEYGLHQWYVDDGISFSPGPHPDVTKPVPGLDMKQVCDYAKSKGVDVRVWVHWAALYPKLDSAFMMFEKWGLKGMMIDFMDRDDQMMVNIQTEMLQKAAKHHLHIQFHGAYKPTGMHRTYPNEFNREGTLNYEINKWDRKGLSPDQDINIPFTRMLAGSTDYHLGGFRAVPQEKFVTQYTRPLMLGTRCHQLGMYVVLENYLGMVCDYPLAYEGQPGFDFISSVPTVWDETKVLDAKLDEYIVIARRKGNDWYIGGINNHAARTLEIPLTFLGPGSYTATLYSDSDDITIDPNHLVITTTAIGSGELLHLKLAGGGGVAIHISPR